VTMIPTPAEYTARRSRASTETAPGRVKLGPTVSNALTAPTRLVTGSKR